MPTNQRAYRPSTAAYLHPPFEHFVKGLTQCGFWKATLINSAVQHQVIGRFHRLAQRKHRFMSFAPAIEATLFLNKWQYIDIAQNEPKPTLTLYDTQDTPCYHLKSIQETDSEESRYLDQHLLQSGQAPSTPARASRLRSMSPKRSIDKKALIQTWRNLQHPQEANQIFKAHQHNLPDLYQALSPNFSRRMPVSQLPTLFEACRRQALPLQFSARNHAIVQNYQGRVRKLLQLEHELIIADAGFKLHLNLSQINQAWWLQTPSAKGTIYNLKLFDFRGMEVLSLCDQPLHHSTAAWIKLSETYHT